MRMKRGVPLVAGGLATMLVTAAMVMPAGDAAALELQWTRVYQRPQRFSFSTPMDAAVDADGGIYFVGYVEGSRLLAVKYSPSGEHLWTRMPDFLAVSPDDDPHLASLGTGISLGADGGVFVVGVAGNRTVPFGCVLQRYSREGALEWSRRYDSPFVGPGPIHVSGGCECNDVAVSPDGSVYVVGHINVDGMAAYEGENLLLLKYTAAGDFVWSRMFNVPDGYVSMEYGWGVAAAPDGSVYVVGESNTARTNYRARQVLQKYSPSGARLWTRMATQPSGGGLVGSKVSVLRDGVVFVSGYYWCYDDKLTSHLCHVVQRYSPAGELLWYRDMGRGVSGPAFARDGSYFVTSEVDRPAPLSPAVELKKYSRSGRLVWSSGVLSGPKGSLRVSGHPTVGPGGELVLVGTVDFTPDGFPPDEKTLLMRFR